MGCKDLQGKLYNNFFFKQSINANKIQFDNRIGFMAVSKNTQCSVVDKKLTAKIQDCFSSFKVKRFGSYL